MKWRKNELFKNDLTKTSKNQLSKQRCLIYSIQTGEDSQWIIFEMFKKTDKQTNKQRDKQTKFDV
jgi:hypothetical protein